MADKINNAVARVWTTKELNETIKQAKEQNCEVIKTKYTTIIKHEGNTILMSLSTGRAQMVRLDETYFE